MGHGYTTVKLGFGPESLGCNDSYILEQDNHPSPGFLLFLLHGLL